MQRKQIFIVCLSIGVCASVTMFAIWAFSVPLSRRAGRAIAIKPIYDFGTLSQNETVSASFEIWNNDSSAIDLLKVMSNCDCTSAGLGTRTLAPGEKTTLVASWNVGTRRGESVSKIVVLYKRSSSLTPDTSSIPLYLKAKVIGDYDHNPKLLIFHPSVSSTAVVRFIGQKQGDLSVLNAVCTHRAFTAEIGQDRRTVTVDFEKDLWVGTHASPHASSKLFVTTNSRFDPICQIEIQVDATADFKGDPFITPPSRSRDTE